jgi:hypothetical protein
MAEEIVAELCGSRGFTDVHAVLNCVARLSAALEPNKDPGVVCSVATGSAKGAPYSKPTAGKIRVRCSNWSSGPCEVCLIRKMFCFGSHGSCAAMCCCWSQEGG